MIRTMARPVKEGRGGFGSGASGRSCQLHFDPAPRMLSAKVKIFGRSIISSLFVPAFRNIPYQGHLIVVFFG